MRGVLLAPIIAAAMILAVLCRLGSALYETGKTKGDRFDHT